MDFITNNQFINLLTFGNWLAKLSCSSNEYFILKTPSDTPAANLFLMSEKRYPGPASSMSQPDRVLPSLVNCTASGAGLLGPSVS